MCGLAGYLNRKGAANNVSLHILQSMIANIRHRGPDSQGTWLNDQKEVGLAHARLSIVELSEAGHQPMLSACSRYALVFNGEIYNHLSLRAKLQAEHSCIAWRGGSDTETLLECISAWGIVQTLQSVVGMFAFALWDEHERKLVLARDRFGEKPIYWGWQGDVFLFGSELKALRAHPNFKSEVDRNALALFLRHNYVPAPYSIYQGIEKLRPGHYLSVQIDSADKSLRSVSYWDINDAINCGLASPFMGSDKEAIDRLDEILTTGISGQMLADVPLGAFLSGGVDSSVIVALMQKQSSRPIRTFTIGFHEAGFNEAEHALAVSRYLGTEHTEVYVGASDALSLVPNLPHIYCEPFADSSQIPTFLVSQMARQHVTVALSGDAGDELFGGYNPYRFAPRVWNKLSTVPLSVRRASAYLASWSNFPAKVTKLLEVGNAPTREEFYRRLISHWLYPEQVVLNSHEPSTLLSQPGSWPYVDNFEHWMMAMDAQTYMVDDILVKVDRAAMANSLETRVPLLDHRLVEFAWSLPFHMKIRDGKGKWILRELLYRYVPKELIERPKKGFSIPLGNWLKGPLREWSESLLDPSRLAQEGYFNSQIVAKVWREHLAGKSDRSRQLWSILMFQSWLREQGH